MAVSLFRWEDENPYVYSNLADGEEVFFFDPLDERGEDSVGDRYRSLDPSLRYADVLVIRSSARSMSQQVIQDPVIRRLGPDRVFTLSRSYEPGRPHPVLTPITAEARRAQPNPDELRAAEVDSILHRTGAVMEEKDHHYLLPSGWHAERFIRLATALRSIVDCRRLADWVLAYMTSETDILGDTGSLLPMVQEVQRHCQTVFGWKTRVDALDEYPTVADIANRMRDMEHRSRSRDRQVLFVVSVSSSGDAVNRFQQVVGDDCDDAALVVCDTDPDGTPATTMVSLPTQRWRAETSGECAECGSPAVVAIDPASYDPLTRFEVSPVPISPDLARTNVPLFQFLSDRDALRVHHTSDRRAHYAVWVDTERVLAAPEIVSRFSDFVVESAQAVDLVLVPDGPAQTQLAAVAGEIQAATVALVEAEGSFDAATEDMIASADHVLVLDDVIVSGTTLGRLRRRIYYAAQKQGRSPKVSAVVWLARPARHDVLASLSRPYRGKDGVTLFHLEKALLPSGRDCSWCREMDTLRTFRGQLSAPSVRTLDGRLQRLEGDVRSPMLIGSSDERTSLRTEGAFFGNLTEIAAVCAAASAVRGAVETMREESTPRHTQVIDVGVAMDAFFDDALLVGIVRACSKRQVRFAALDPAISAKYERLAQMGEELSAAVRCELGWAVAMELLPAVGFASVIADIEVPEAGLIREILSLGSRGDGT